MPLFDVGLAPALRGAARFRAWARSHNIPVPARGRIPAPVRTAYAMARQSESPESPLADGRKVRVKIKSRRVGGAVRWPTPCPSRHRRRPLTQPVGGTREIRPHEAGGQVTHRARHRYGSCPCVRCATGCALLPAGGLMAVALSAVPQGALLRSCAVP
ncbi:Lsr2 family DNA-binding protein [Actinacidiphila guanduensis]